jgi:hypothetical protein
MNIEQALMAVETERKRLLKAARDRQMAAVEKWLRRGTKAIRKSRSEVQRSRDLAAAAREPRPERRPD